MEEDGMTPLILTSPVSGSAEVSSPATIVGEVPPSSSSRIDRVWKNPLVSSFYSFCKDTIDEHLGCIRLCYIVSFVFVITGALTVIIIASAPPNPVAYISSFTVSVNDSSAKGIENWDSRISIHLSESLTVEHESRVWLEFHQYSTLGIIGDMAPLIWYDSKAEVLHVHANFPVELAFESDLLRNHCLETTVDLWIQANVKRKEDAHGSYLLIRCQNVGLSFDSDWRGVVAPVDGARLCIVQFSSTIYIDM